MVTNPRSTISESPAFELVRNENTKKPKSSKKLTARVVSTLLALLALAIVLRYMAPTSRNGQAQAQAEQSTVAASAEELQLSSLQITLTAANEELFIDGVVTNTAHAAVTG